MGVAERVISGLSTCGGILVFSALASDLNMVEVLAHSEQYATEVDGCALVDGYHCIKRPQDDFLTKASQARLVSGNFLKAWQSAVVDFQNQPDQSQEQTQLKHYKIGFTESADHYIILFQALLLPIVEEVDGETAVTGLLRQTLGRTTKYWIAKDSFRVDSKLFYK